MTLAPPRPDAEFLQCTLLESQGRMEEAWALYRHARTHGTLSPEFALYGATMLPAIPASLEEIATWRNRFQEGIADLQTRFHRLDPATLATARSLYYYLAYHNLDDRSLIESLGQLFRAKVPELTMRTTHPPTRLRAGQRRLRIGFLSQFFYHHTIGRLNEGLIQLLDRTRFELVLIHTPHSKKDAFRDHLDALADRVILLPEGITEQQRVVAAAELDILYYPDIGMSMASYWLTFARLAPVQAMSWGHPETTGVDTMDYFVSSALIEPEGADERYRERLIRLHRLPCCYLWPVVPGAIPDRSAYGLPTSGHLYGCPQSLYKLHPEFDAVLAEIVREDPTGHIVLVAADNPIWQDALRARWNARHPGLAQRVLFLPRMTRTRFIGLMANMDVLLDPIHFGSGNTFYEAMAIGTPVITWPGEFMRCRIVAGGYRQMGMTDPPVANRVAEYAALALSFAQDKPRRRAFQRELAEKRAALFVDAGMVREFETFLTSAVAAAMRGGKLPGGWQPPRGG
ncbi:MAG: glycosyltransferase [Magnetococcales bacterium]|nr:glycosyltransferase [Magnetococcales bacterium]